MNPLTDQDVYEVINVSSKRKRKRVESVTPRYRAKQRKEAEELAKDWYTHGVPQDIYDNLVLNNPALISKFGWTRKPPPGGNPIDQNADVTGDDADGTNEAMQGTSRLQNISDQVGN